MSAMTDGKIRQEDSLQHIRKALPKRCCEWRPEFIARLNLLSAEAIYGKGNQWR